MTHHSRWLSQFFHRAFSGVLLGSALLQGVLTAQEIPAELAQEREWDFAHQGTFRGVLVDIVEGKAHIRMADGVVRVFEPGWSSGRSGSTLRRALCRLPTKPSRPSVVSTGTAPVLELSAEGLPPGGLARWNNRGTLGGAFLAMNQPPVVRQVNGRQAVHFTHAPWQIPLENQALISDFIFPAAELYRTSFTVVMEVINTDDAPSRENILTWSTLSAGGHDSVEFGYGCFKALDWYGDKLLFPPMRFPQVNQWHQLAFVVDKKEGGERKDKDHGVVALFVDGVFLGEQRIGSTVKRPLDDNHAFIGCSWESAWGGSWASRPAHPFTGGIASLRLYNRALAVHEFADGPAATAVIATPAPRHGEVVPTLTPTLAWKPLTTSAAYRLYLSQTRAEVEQGAASALVQTVTTPSHACARLVRGGRYFWKVLPAGAPAASAAVWEFTVGDGGAEAPQPASGVAGISADVGSLRWRPAAGASSQRLYIGTDRTAVANGTTSIVVGMAGQAREAFVTTRHLLATKEGEAGGAKDEDEDAGEEGSHDEGRPVYVPLERLASGTTYHWRVDQVMGEAKSSKAPPPPAVPGEVWSFTTSPLDLEDDGPVSEPFPSAVRSDGYYQRFMRAPGCPIISPIDALDEYMRSARHSLAKLTGKRPDIVAALDASSAGCHLSTPESRGWSVGRGWSQYTCAAYGGGYAIARRSAILMHEMGHQYHMNGIEMLESDFHDRLNRIFTTNYRERKWMGGYASKNKHENVAVWASAWINDGSFDVGIETPREKYRKNDPRMFDLLSAYWPGDTIIELDPARGVERSATGALSAWRNSGGIEFFEKEAGWRTYARSRGRFLPTGSPTYTTVAGVSAIACSGKDTLRWDQATWDAIDGNRAWSVEAWVYRASAATGPETLLDWDRTGKPEARLSWGGDDEAWRFGEQAGRWRAKPQPGQWHHVFYVYSGGGLANGPGTLTVHVDGVVDHRATVTLDLPVAAHLTLARGFTGALAHLRIYNYELHPAQIAEISREDAWFARDRAQVAGSLLIDLAGDRLEPYQQVDVWPTYPASLQKPWVRSWANRGLLGGRVHNEGGATRQRGPRAGVFQGTSALSFSGDVRMASEVLPPLPARVSVELWASLAVKPEAAAVLVQLGDLVVPAAVVPVAGWHHVVMTSTDGRQECWVDGAVVPLPAGRPAAVATAARLCLGGRWDGAQWSGHLTGALAQVRVHAGILDREQIAANRRAGMPNQADAPGPADGSEVIEPSPALTWSLGTQPTAAADVYLGSDLATVQRAERGSSGVYQGRHRPGTFRPTLKPGQAYVWRVDALDADGKILGRGACWTFRTVHGLLVDLDASGLAPGAFTTWRNQGVAGGAFEPGTIAETWMPLAMEHDGRAAVSFDGGTYLLSSFKPPASLAKAFTVAARVYAEDLPGNAKERSNTFLSLGVREAGGTEFLWNWQPTHGLFMHGTGKNRCDFGYRSGIDDVKVAREALPAYQALRWHHVAYTYAEAGGGTLRIHIDGRLHREEKAAVALAGGVPFCLGAVRGEKRMESWFTGWLSELYVADRVVPDQELVALARPDAKPRAGDWLVALQASDLPAGRVAAWANRGSLGGTMAVEQEPSRAPLIEEVAGRRALTFDGRNTFLRSDITTPPTLAGGHAFTIEAVLFNPRLEQVETIVALAPSVAMLGSAHLSLNRMATCNVGSAKVMDAASKANDIPSAFAGGKPTLAWSEPPPAGRWCRVAWVYSGGSDGELRCYVDGQLRAQRGAVSLNTAADQPMFIAAAWNTAHGPLGLYAGSLAQVRMYDYAKTAAQLSAP